MFAAKFTLFSNPAQLLIYKLFKCSNFVTAINITITKDLAK
jgi:hypothetical protein